MDRNVWGRRLSLALVLVLGLLVMGTAVSFAAPGESPDDWCRGYVVRKGDTLSGISWRYGVSWQALASYNGIKNPNFIKAGSCLYIPPRSYYGYYNKGYYGGHQQHYGYYGGGHWVWRPGQWVWVPK